MRDGKRCRAYAQEGSKYCFMHDPAKSSDRRKAQKQGGRARTATLAKAVLPKDTPDISLSTPQEIQQLIASTINQVRRGEIAPQIANAVGYLVNIGIKAIETGDIEERLKRIEEALAQGQYRRVG